VNSAKGLCTEPDARRCANARQDKSNHTLRCLHGTALSGPHVSSWPTAALRRCKCTGPLRACPDAARVAIRVTPALETLSASREPSIMTAVSFGCVAFVRPPTTVPLAITSPVQARVKSSVGAPSSVNDDQGLRIVPRETSRPMDELTPPARMEG
jgi:hypothetical protein